MAEPDPPTALFTSQNLVTLGALRALHHLGLQDQVAQVGFDDFALSDLLRPGITVLAQDPARIGAIAAERIFARLDGDTSPGGDLRGAGPADHPGLGRDSAPGLTAHADHRTA